MEFMRNVKPRVKKALLKSAFTRLASLVAAPGIVILRYHSVLYDPEPYANAAVMQKRATRATAIVIFTDGLVPRQGLDVRYVEVSPGVQLAYVRIEPGAVLQFYGDRYTVREPE